jgi:hypothetical protein
MRRRNVLAATLLALLPVLAACRAESQDMEFTAGERFHAGELRFADDPLVTGAEREASKRAGNFGEVRSVRLQGRTQHVDWRRRLEPRDRF